jgi:hypothetical protein
MAEVPAFKHDILGVALSSNSISGLTLDPSAI